jgi:hypothetical protein
MALDPAWQASLDSFKRELDGQAEGAPVSAGLRELFAVQNITAWTNDRKVFTFGQLEAGKLIPACREGLLPWWVPFTSRVFNGDLDGAKKIHAAFEADKGAGEKPNMSSALTWIVYPNSLTDGCANTINPKVVRQLLAWGADANYESGKWLTHALKNLDGDGIAAFLDHGASTATVMKVMDEMQTAKNYAQLGRIQTALSQCKYFKVDEQTLMESKYMPDMKGGSVFKTLFNFRSRRVHEIYEPGQGAAAMVDGIPFAEYDAEALRFAQEKLEQLGGKPRPFDVAFDKPKKPRLGLAAAGGNSP